MAELSKQVDRLTVDHLAIMARGIKAGIPRTSEDPMLLAQCLAMEALRFFLGNQWTNENLFSIHKDVSAHNQERRRFLRTDSIEPHDQARHMWRIVTLAEALFNLQGIDGLRQRISLMERNDLESALGEMECASLLSHPELQFRFINPTGSKGSDYEAEVITSAKRTVCCEMKAKSEQTSLGGRTLWSAVESARKQLPKSQPGLVLVKVPEEWTRQLDGRKEVDEAISKALRQSQRLVGVVLYWENWYPMTDGGNLVTNMFETYRNRNSNLYGSDIDDLFAVIGCERNPSWVSFSTF